MSLTKTLLTEATNPADLFVQKNKGVLEQILPFSKIVKKAEVFKDKFYDNELTKDSKISGVEDYVWDKLGEWHNKYEDVYYDKLTGGGAFEDYDAVMADRQQKAIDQVLDIEEFEEKISDIYVEDEHGRDLEKMWKSTRGV